MELGEYLEHLAKLDLPGERVVELIGKASLAKKKAKAMTLIQRVDKSGWNDFDNYDYATADDVLECVRPALGEAGLSVNVNVTNIERSRYNTSKGSQWRFYEVELEYELTCSDTGFTEASTIEVEAADKGDKGLFKAYTMAAKYWSRCTFFVSTGDGDVEADEDVNKEFSKAKPVDRGNGRRRKSNGGRKRQQSGGDVPGVNNRNYQRQEQPPQPPSDEPKKKLWDLDYSAEKFNFRESDEDKEAYQKAQNRLYGLGDKELVESLKDELKELYGCSSTAYVPPKVMHGWCTLIQKKGITEVLDFLRQKNGKPPIEEADPNGHADPTTRDEDEDLHDSIWGEIRELITTVTASDPEPYRTFVGAWCDDKKVDKWTKLTVGELRELRDSLAEYPIGSTDDETMTRREFMEEIVGEELPGKPQEQEADEVEAEQEEEAPEDPPKAEEEAA